MPEFQLAQINVALMRAPLTDPLMADFVAQLDPINALADGSAGFVWRLQSAGGDATDIRPYGDEPILVNMSVWKSVEHLRDYVYRSAHTGVLRDRKQWFGKFEGAYYALWWVPAGHRPTAEEGKARLDYLRAHGETEYAFSFTRPFPPPDSPFTFETDAEAEAYCLLIAEQMVEQFSITHEEAIGRINRSWAGFSIRGPLDWIYHEVPEVQARSVYYGPYAYWWKEGADLTPRPYP